MEKRVRIESPEAYIKKALRFFCIDGSYALAKIALFTSLITSLLSYSLLVIYGNGNPDALCEGVVHFRNAGWALACGRWAIRYMNAATANVIMPAFIVLGYMLCVFLAILLLAKLWGIKRKLSILVLAVVMNVTPAMIAQSLFTYMYLAWGLSTLLGVAFVYIGCMNQNKWLRLLLPAPCLAVALGLYQSAVGVVSLCFGMTLILRLVDADDMRAALRRLLRFIISCAIGAALYFLILQIGLKLHGIAASDRVTAFSFGQIFRSLPGSVAEAYRAFYGYFADGMLGRKIWYLLLFVFLAAFFVQALIRRFREGKRIEALACLPLFAAIPLLANIVVVLIPYNGVGTIMSYQNVFMFPFLLALMERTNWRGSLYNLGRSALYVLALGLGFSYVVSANATYACYELSYRHLNFETSAILGEVYALPDYSGEDTIVFAGFVDDSFLRSSLSVYKYAIGLTENVAFWTNAHGLQQSRYRYLQHYFGVDAKFVDEAAYNEAIASDEFAAMGIYPQADSIRRINGLVIVKLCEEPPAL